MWIEGYQSSVGDKFKSYVHISYRIVISDHTSGERVVEANSAGFPCRTASGRHNTSGSGSQTPYRADVVVDLPISALELLTS